MAYESVSTNPLNIVANDADVRAQTSTFLGGTYAKEASFAAHTALPGLTPLKRDATTKKLVPATALTDVVIGLSVPGIYSVDPTGLVTADTVDPKTAVEVIGGVSYPAIKDSLASAASDASLSYFTHGDFFAKAVDVLRGITVDLIYWGYYTTTPANDLEKQSVFDNTGINLKFPTTGAN